MKLQISNFAKIEKADINIDGITVICGDNNTAKSTIGKILFSIFDSNFDIDKKIVNELGKDIEKIILRDIYTRNKKIVNVFRPKFRFINGKAFLEKINYPNINNKELDDIKNIINEYIRKMLSNIDNDIIDNISKDILEKIITPYNKIIEEIINRYFNSIFKNQINNIFDKRSSASLRLEIKKQIMDINFKNDECVKFKSKFNITHNAFYIDNPFIIDNLDKYGKLSIIENKLINSLTKGYDTDPLVGIFDSINAKDTLKEVYDIISKIIDGKIIEKNGDFYINYREYDVDMSLNNLSTGLKSFVIIKMLLENGSLAKKDVLILDEPEIHLHPEWQLTYAELIVLLQKHFELNIIITTHSHYFLDAINRFSIKYETYKSVNFYITEYTDNKKNIVFINVNEKLDEIYKKMYLPLEKLKNMRLEENNETRNS